jgi:hypothetical protein
MQMRCLPGRRLHLRLREAGRAKGLRLRAAMPVRLRLRLCKGLTPVACRRPGPAAFSSIRCFPIRFHIEELQQCFEH